MLSTSFGFELGTNTVAALHNVDLRLYGGIHGGLVKIEPYGPACTGLIDGDYQGVQDIVDDLNPRRGDVLALEATYFQPEHNDNGWFRSYMRVHSESSALVHTNPSDMDAFAAEAREAQIISTHQYAKCLAITKGLRTALVDASLEDVLAWKMQRQAGGVFERPGQEEETAFRNVKIVERLGATALTMHPTRIMRRRPALAMVVGDRHVQSVADLLEPYSIVPQIKTYSPDLYQRHAAALDFIKVHGQDPDALAWVARARAIASRHER